MTKGSRLLGSALLALLALAVISSGSFAGGDLFDADYSDCPVGTRLRDGQITDLTMARASDEADEVNVAWDGHQSRDLGAGPQRLQRAPRGDPGRQPRHPCGRNAVSRFAEGHLRQGQNRYRGDGAAGDRGRHRGWRLRRQRHSGDERQPEPDGTFLRRPVASTRRGHTGIE